MLKRGLLLALCAVTLTGCVIHPAHLRFTPPRVDLVVDGHGGGHHGGNRGHGGHHGSGHHGGGHRGHGH
jgi:hypothetical protein